MTSFRASLLDEGGKIFHGEDIDASDQTAQIDAGLNLFKRHPGAPGGSENRGGERPNFTSLGLSLS